MRELLQHGADPDLRDGRGAGPLHIMVPHNNVAIAKVWCIRPRACVRVHALCAYTLPERSGQALIPYSNRDVKD